MSNFKLYILNYQAKDNSQIAIVNEWLRLHSTFLDVISPIPLTYLIKSRRAASSIQKQMKFLFPEGNYIVAEIDPQNSDGMLGQKIWDWVFEQPVEGKRNRSQLLQITSLGQD